ncbi:MAG: hypothetical protein M1819_005943 [Sarea resinae]|nr:MAG: hypothetical protein M1819_005943 [Sarea resinae]
MLASLFKSKFKGPRDEYSPVSSPLERRRSHNTNHRHRCAGNSEDSDEGEALDEDEGYSEDDDDDDGEDGREEGSPLLPIFSAAHLDALPIYNLTHAIRLLIIPRCETMLTWDQLRSPQVSQFLVKPIQQQIRTSHFSRGIIYALMANCLQFIKEGQRYPGSSGTNKTRAMLNALSYDFHPLQGLTPGTGSTTPAPALTKAQYGAVRISTLEIAIRAQAKKFLAHPLVVQQLEAIWAGTIVFHSAADYLHRLPPKIRPNENRGYGATAAEGRRFQDSAGTIQPNKHHQPLAAPVRRSVTLYDPQDASLFKLSRLRVPCYRQTLSTCSLAVLLGLLVAVLMERSLDITGLEVIFWFWSAGFMLDEIVGFNEQGFSLYIMSFWNIFDIGILLLFVVYYCMRLYGILMPDVRKHHIADMAYDILAANAVLLFPRLFSVLDHYRYFSQLLIAFRMMAIDLAAVFVLIGVSCSGFFVAFTLSFGDAYDAKGVAYALFQMIMGFTPAAWEAWPKYNALGKAILTLFLFITHFLIVTILITVLTNSFMAIVQNANEEHQFVFAVNLISMVKSDALFSYIAPTNIIAWFLTPLRYIIPFRQYVKINRTAIKMTHFPVLFCIYAYERLILRNAVFEPTDLIENRGRAFGRAFGIEPFEQHANVFSPAHRLREPSVATFQKDRALDEVFRRPYKSSGLRGVSNLTEPRTTSHAVNNWMQSMGPDGRASPPIEQPRSVVDRLETRRPRLLRHRVVSGNTRDFTDATRSIASDPEDFTTTTMPETKTESTTDDFPNISIEDFLQEEDGDGDDEMLTHDEDGDATSELTGGDEGATGSDKENLDEDFLLTPTKAKPQLVQVSSISSSVRARMLAPLQESPGFISSPSTPRRRTHERMPSSSTILYKPASSPKTAPSSPRYRTAMNTAVGSGAQTPSSEAKRSPRRPQLTSFARPIMPPRSHFQSAPDVNRMLAQPHQLHRWPSSAATDMASDMGERLAGAGIDLLGGVPSSFATQMALATGAVRGDSTDHTSEESRRMTRLVLTRMNTLEESFRDVVNEMKEWRREGSKGSRTEESDGRREREPKGKAKAQTKSRRSSRMREGFSHRDFETKKVPFRDDGSSF